MGVLETISSLEHEADAFGFRWENTSQIMVQIQSECLEIQEHLNDLSTSPNKALLQEEIGDLLHAVFSLCVFCQLDPKETLEKTLTKFERRLHAVKKISEIRGLKNLEGLNFDDLMVIWDQAKKQVG